MRRSLRSWLWRVPVDQEVEEELAFHLEMRTRELMERGMSLEEARHTARRRMGDLASLKRTCAELGRKRDREMRLTQWLEELRDDVRFAVRQMWRAPGFTAVAVITLALGIGANSAIFALVDATLLRPLPFPDHERLVMIWERTDASPREQVSAVNMLDWRDSGSSLESVGAFVPSVGGMVMAGADGVADTVPRQWVTAGIFDALGIRPVAGRTFLPSDNDQQANVVVLSEAFWQARFNRDPAVIGRDVRLDGTPFTIVGVVPKEAELLGRTSIWAMAPVARRPEGRRFHALNVIGRLKPGVTIESARADLEAVAAGLAREFPDTNRGRGVTIEPLHDAVVGSELRLTAMLFLGVVGVVLLICCANIANLLLARGAVRSRELAIRSALGAGRRRVIRQLLTESLVLSAVGCALGLAVGVAILNVAPALIPESLLPGSLTLSFDGRVVAFCAGTALLVGLLFGMAPAWQATSTSLTDAIVAGSRTVTARGGGLRAALVVGEVATAVLLLFGAGLLLRTLIAVENVDRGYRAESVLTMIVDPLSSEYPTDEAELQFYDAVEEEIAALPNVRGVAWASTLPLGRSYAGETTFEIEGEPPVEERLRPSADFQTVSAGYFETLDLPIVAGRAFTKRDAADSVPVCIVNEALARRYFPEGSPIGRRLVFRSDGPDPPAVKEIVGVARQVKGRPDETDDFLQIYVPMRQFVIGDLFLTVRPESGSAADLAPSVRAAIARIDRAQLVSVRDVMTLDEVVWDATARHRFRAVLVITFAALALALALVGVFGILAYSVQQRTRDFGLRRALGATTADVLRLVGRQAASLIVTGAAIGLLLSTMLGRLLSTVLFGVQPVDPVTLIVVTVLLALTAAIAVAGPAWRAVRVDPAAALRVE